MDPKNIDIKDFNYPLPDELIAKHPVTERDTCKLLVRRDDGKIEDRTFADLPGMLQAGSMLVYNNTRVINARLRFRKHSGALIEIFCLEPENPSDYAMSFASTDGCSWNCLVGNSKRWKDGCLEGSIDVGGKRIRLTATRTEKDDNGSVIEFGWDDKAVSFSEIINAAGEIPIPPYLNRPTERSDSDDYQTVYGHIEGSVAAPTAGLHFTDRLLDEIDKRGISRREVTLHVGAGTFRPVKADKIGGHDMHSEFISVDADLIRELARTPRKKVIAVGTTSVRTLESLYHIGCMMHEGTWEGEVPQWYPYSDSHPRLTVSEALATIAGQLRSKGLDRIVASTRIMIAPGYEYRLVDGMVTNFHQPQSTLLLLVSAFIGPDWRTAYDHALSTGYRFLSYGDACLFFKPSLA